MRPETGPYRAHGRDVGAVLNDGLEGFLAAPMQIRLRCVSQAGRSSKYLASAATSQSIAVADIPPLRM